MHVAMRGVRVSPPLREQQVIHHAGASREDFIQGGGIWVVQAKWEFARGKNIAGRWSSMLGSGAQ
jgi:hypothetical protein